MPVIHSKKITFADVQMDGIKGASKADVIGPPQGWHENALRIFSLEPNGHTPRHQHDWEHVNYILKGQGTLLIGETVHNLAAGDYALVPPNIEHQFTNSGTEPFEFICIVPTKGA